MIPNLDISLSVTFDYGTLIEISTTFLQDSLHLEKFLTVLLSTALVANKATMLPIFNFMENNSCSVFTSLATRDLNK